MSLLPLLLGCLQADPSVAAPVTSPAPRGAEELPPIVHLEDWDPDAYTPGDPLPILISSPKDTNAGRIACAASCSAPDPADHHSLEAELIPHLMAEWNTQPVGQATEEIETLLFYLHDTRDFVAEHGTPGLDQEHARFLHQELGRDRVTMEMRLLAEDGSVRTWLPATEFPLWEKQHLSFKGTTSLGHLETGGKAKRVGLAHLWTRW
ncbi:MAG: hypothetical protein VX899_01380 [Myxococcota bacterium]|nr:hypothetical protein [Myxococcota bacterium]